VCVCVCLGRTCSAVDLVFVVGVSDSDFYRSYIHPFMVVTINRVTISESQYKAAVVSFSDRAVLKVRRILRVMKFIVICVSI